MRTLRAKQGLSQEDFAVKCGLHRTYMGKIERGEINLTLEKVYRIAKALDCDVRELLPQADEVTLGQ